MDAVTDESDTTGNYSTHQLPLKWKSQRAASRRGGGHVYGKRQQSGDRVLVHAVGDEDATFTYFSAFSPCCRPDLADPPKGIDIEKVDGGLEITAEGPGSCQITISSTDVESSILPVAVYMKPATLEVSPSTVSLEVDGTATRPPRRSLNDDVFRKRAARGKLP